MVRRRWTIGWLGAVAAAIANGAARDTLYLERLGERRAQQVSSATLLGLLAGVMWGLDRRWHLETDADALAAGGRWLGLTVLFEFGFGHWVAGDPWSELLAAYDVRKRSLWPLVLLWTAAGPLVVSRARR